jgi:hypothetical protein
MKGGRMKDLGQDIGEAKYWEWGGKKGHASEERVIYIIWQKISNQNNIFEMANR